MNGTRFSREEWNRGEGRRWLLGTLSACGADGSLAVDFQVDDSIRWEEACAVMQVAFETDVEPEVFILEDGNEGQRIPIWRPADSATDDSVPVALISPSGILDHTFESQFILTGGEPPAVFQNETWLGRGPLGIESLHDQVVSLVKVQGFTVTPDLQIDGEIRFRWVYAAMKALSIEADSTTTSDSKTRIIQLDGLEWWRRNQEAITHGGII